MLILAGLAIAAVGVYVLFARIERDRVRRGRQARRRVVDQAEFPNPTLTQGFTACGGAFPFPNYPTTQRTSNASDRASTSE